MFACGSDSSGTAWYPCRKGSTETVLCSGDSGIEDPVRFGSKRRGGRAEARQPGRAGPSSGRNARNVAAIQTANYREKTCGYSGSKR